MNISLDYDDTYTRDPEFWNSFVRGALQRGHKVYCITLRSPQQSHEVYESLAALIGVDNCIFTSMNAKKKFAWDKGVRIDVWIDDMPDVIGGNDTLFNFGTK